MQIQKINSKAIFFIIASIQLLIMLWMSQDVGISADENRHIQQAEKVYNYYKTDGEDKSALEKTGMDPMQFNGQSFDNLMYVITQKFEVEKYIEMRHLFIAIIGWLIIFITGLIIKKSLVYEGAILAILLLFISPRFLGHALNNNKDIPFALGFILSIYGMVRLFSDLPKIKIWNIIWLTLGIGIAISIRLAGILSIGLLGLFSAIYYLSQKPYFKPFQKEKFKTLKKIIIIVPLVSLIGFFIGIVYWPFMMEDPITNLKTVLDATNSHPVSLNQLFNGKIILSSQIPSNYVLTYVYKSYPLVILAGILFAVTIAPFKLKKEHRFNFLIITFSFFFVLIWMSIENSNFYGGIRHLLFIYPIAIGIAVFGYYFLRSAIEKIENKWLKLLPYTFIILLSIGPVIHLIKNYPYSYVYFNEMAGGVKKACYKYETDYFQHSLRQSTEWFIENELPKLSNDTNKIKVITNDGFNTGYYLRKVSNKVESNYARYYEKSKEDWDYAILYCGYISPTQISRGLWPPKGTIHTEEVDGFPIGAVVKRLSKEDFNGFEAMKKRKVTEAKKHFKNFLDLYPENEEVLEGYARACLMERKIDSTIIYADSSIYYNPRQMGAYFLKASAYNAEKKWDEALTASNNMLEIKEEFAEGQYQKGIALKNLNKPNDALQSFQKASSLKKDYYEALMQMGEILINYSNFKKALDIYKKVFDFKKDDFYASVYTAKCYQMLNDKNKAEELLNTLPPNNQNNLEVVKVKYRIAMSQNDMQNAGRYLNMARNINNNSELFVLRAMYVLKQNQKEQAQQFLEKAKELDPINREAQDLLKTITTNQAAAQKPAARQETETQPQSIMFQKPKAKKQTSPLKIPGK